MAKEKVICDTDVLINYFDEKNSRHVETIKILEKNIILDNVMLSSISKMELILGATNKADLHRINRDIERLNITLINYEINEHAIFLLQKYSLSHGLSLPDSLIAATSIVTGFELFTYNVKDYKFIDKIRLYKF